MSINNSHNNGGLSTNVQVDSVKCAPTNILNYPGREAIQSVVYRHTVIEHKPQSIFITGPVYFNEVPGSYTSGDHHFKWSSSAWRYAAKGWVPKLRAFAQQHGFAVEVEVTKNNQCRVTIRRPGENKEWAVLVELPCSATRTRHLKTSIPKNWVLKEGPHDAFWASIEKEGH